MSFNIFTLIWMKDSKYCKFVKTSHIVSECKTADYFERCLVHRLTNNTADLIVSIYSI